MAGVRELRSEAPSDSESSYFDDLESEIDERFDLIGDAIAKPDWRLSACCASCCCVVFFLVIAIYTWPYYLGDVQDTWIAYINSPPPSVQNLSRELLVRADHIAKVLEDRGTMVPPSLDIVCSGGGMLSMYCVGAHSVLKSLERLNRTKVARMAGASGGGDFAFRAGIYSDRTIAIEQNLALAQVEAEHPWAFSLPVVAMTVDDLWRILGHAIVDNPANNLTRLSDVAFLSITVLVPWPKTVVASRYTSRTQAYEAFIGTGSCFILPSAVSRLEFFYDGKLAFDGALLDCEPHFTDDHGWQLVVSLDELDVENKDAILLGKYTIDEAVRLMEKGQDDVATLVRSFNQEQRVTRSPEVPAMRILGESAEEWDTFDCTGSPLSDTNIVLIQVGYLLSVAFCIVCLPWSGFFCCKRWCRHFE